MGDEFAELDTTEDEFDRAMTAGEPVEVEVPVLHGYTEHLALAGAATPAETTPSGILTARLS